MSPCPVSSSGKKCAVFTGRTTHDHRHYRHARARAAPRRARRPPWIKSGGAGIALYGLISAGGKAARHLPNAGESFLMWVGGAIAIFFAPDIIDIITKIKVA